MAASDKNRITLRMSEELKYRLDVAVALDKTSIQKLLESYVQSYVIRIEAEHGIVRATSQPTSEDKPDHQKIAAPVPADDPQPIALGSSGTELAPDNPWAEGDIEEPEPLTWESVVAAGAANKTPPAPRPFSPLPKKDQVGRRDRIEEEAGLYEAVGVG